MTRAKGNRFASHATPCTDSPRLAVRKLAAPLRDTERRGGLSSPCAGMALNARADALQAYKGNGIRPNRSPSGLA